MLIGAVAYHQYSQDGHYQEQLRAACAAKGGKLALSNLCINLSWVRDPSDARPGSQTRLGFRLRAASRW